MYALREGRSRRLMDTGIDGQGLRMGVRCVRGGSHLLS